MSKPELRAVAAFAAACARPALAIFERARPEDGRPRTAIDAAQAFADGAERSKGLRDAAWAAMRAAHDARDAGYLAAAEAARAAMAAAGAGFLHPLAKATQVKHILGPAAHAARAFELAAEGEPALGGGGVPGGGGVGGGGSAAGGKDAVGSDRGVAAEHLGRARDLAGPVVADVLRRYPAAPPGGGRVGELMRLLDAWLR